MENATEYTEKQIHSKLATAVLQKFKVITQFSMFSFYCSLKNPQPTNPTQPSSSEFNTCCTAVLI